MCKYCVIILTLNVPKHRTNMAIFQVLKLWSTLTFNNWKTVNHADMKCMYSITTKYDDFNSSVTNIYVDI